MNWQFDNNTPIYTQIVSKYRFAIASGELKPGAKLAAVRDIAMEAGVNPNTMQRAFQELERMGLVFTQRSSGRFVTEDINVIDETKKAFAGEHIKRFLSTMAGLGFSRDEIMSLIGKTMEGNNGNF
ncbi:MAG: GntR family transcriptional regulator [Eubacteriales bacterium]|nr:GntR family transcriptional regulator [Eubacteriales bacterium]